MSIPDDDLMSSLVRELDEDPPLAPELEAEIWTGAQRKIAAGVVVAASAAIAVAAARAASSPAAGSVTFSSIVSSAAGKVALAVALTVGGVSGYVARSLAPGAVPAATQRSPSLSAGEAPAAVVDESPPPTTLPAKQPDRKQRAAPMTEVTKRELVLMDRARAALARENAADALAAVREQQALPAPRGFDEESEAIEVFALGRLDPARAAASARAFLRRHPDSPLVARVRSFAVPISHHGSAR